MGLRCLLGHDFDEPETERERNEEGNEVVVTVREVKTCKRCGEKQVVSENKEITSIDQLRESATGEPAETPASQPSTGAESETGAGGEWSTDELSTGDEGVDAGADTAEAPTEPAPEPESTPEPESAAAESEPAEDPIERGVADIIEQAEKDDDMLENPPAESESEPEEGAESEDDEVPVHPGQRAAEAEESEAPDAESDDGVILDEEEESPPEEARRQWEEEASPEEVPGQDLSVTESTPDGEDAVIIDDEGETEQPATESESPTEPAEPANEPEQATDAPSAVESEDAEIMDAGPEPTPEQSTESAQSESAPSEPEPTEPEPTEPEREETDEGHMPWPDAPGEDEGHDATAPDGEPADIEFGGGITPSDETEAEESDTEIIDADAGIDEVDAGVSEPPETAEDRANGHRTEEGESDDTSTAPTANVDLERSTREAGMEYYCPECGLTRDVGNSSMRAGDICPECRKGYITEQQKAE